MPALQDNACHESAVGFVLAGGRSSRMGSDKALALFSGVPLIQVALEIFAEANIPARIAGARSDLSQFGEQISDIAPDSGPLGGIHAALSASEAEWNVFLPVDLPLMPSSLLAVLLQRAQLMQSPVTAATRNGRLEPFPVVLHRSTLPSIAHRLATGETACHRAWQTIPVELGATLDAVSVEVLLQCGQCHPGRRRSGPPPLLWFQGANTPEELARLNLGGSGLTSTSFLARESSHRPRISSNLRE
jgi:molybdopterin-guanine dinucleotide biosynthesis protein A